MSALASDHLVPCDRCRALVRAADAAAHETWHRAGIAEDVRHAGLRHGRRNDTASHQVTPADEVLPSFAQLRALALRSPLARACIELRKQEITALGWAIRCATPGEADRCPDASAAIRALRYPSPSGSWRGWLDVALEEILVSDSLSLYVRSAVSPGQAILRSGVAGLEILDGATIWPVLNTSGVPQDEFAQYLGTVERRTIARALQAATAPSPGSHVMTYGTGALLYRPCWIRPGTLFGCSPLERALVLAPDGTIDLAATEKKVPGEFGINPGSLGLTGDDWVRPPGAPLPKVLRRHLKSVFDWFLQETCGAPHLKFEWREEE